MQFWPFRDFSRKFGGGCTYFKTSKTVRWYYRTPYRPYADITVHRTVRTLILPYAVPSLRWYYRTPYRPYADITVHRIIRNILAVRRRILIYFIK
jgi:hypothetical protein